MFYEIGYKNKQYLSNYQINRNILSDIAYFCYFIAFKLLAKLYFAQLLLLVAVVATHDAEHLVYGVEEGLHRLVVGDALRVVALHDALQRIRSLYGLLLYDFVVLDDTQSDVRSTTERRLISSSVKYLLATLMMPFLPIFLDGRL